MIPALKSTPRASSPITASPTANNADRFVARMKYPGDIDLLYLCARQEYLKTLADGDMTAAEDDERLPASLTSGNKSNATASCSSATRPAVRQPGERLRQTG